MWDASSSAGIRRESEKGIASVFITAPPLVGIRYLYDRPKVYTS